MWEILDGHTLVALYAISFLVPFAFAYFILRLAGWWHGL